jgi:hypothetical protein
MDEKTKNWFDKFSLGCPWHDSGDCQAITHRDENEDFKILYLFIASLPCLSPAREIIKRKRLFIVPVEMAF